MRRAQVVLLLVLASPEAFAGGRKPEVFERKAAEAYRRAERDIMWLLQTAGPSALSRAKGLKSFLERLRCELCCARLDWRAFAELENSARAVAYVPPAAREPTPAELREVLAFLEQARRAFFSRGGRSWWETLFFLETRVLVNRLLGDRLLWEADRLRLAELKEAQERGDLEHAIISLYHLRRFEEVVLLAAGLKQLSALPPDRKIRILRCVRGALCFTQKGDSRLVAEIASALRSLGDKGEEVGRPLFRDLLFLEGAKSDLARVATIMGRVADRWPLEGRHKRLAALVAGMTALGAGDLRFALPLLEKAAQGEAADYLGALAQGSLGLCLEGLGRYAEAAEAFKLARSGALQIGAESYAVKQAVNCAAAFTALNRYDEAEKVLREVLQKVSKVPQELSVRLTLGAVKYLRARKLCASGPLTAEAEGLLSDAELLFERTGARLAAAEPFAERDYLRALALINTGNVKRRRALAASGPARVKLFSEALGFARRALEVARKGGYDRLSVIAGANLAEAALELGKLEEARRFASWALKAAEAISYFEASWRACLYLGRISEKSGERNAAESWYRKAVEIVERYRRCQGGDTFRASFLYNKIEAYENLARVLLAQGKTAEAFSVAERAKARTVLESLGLKELVASLGKNNPALLKLADVLQKLSALQSAPQEPLARAVAQAARPVSLQNLQRELSALLESLKGMEPPQPALSYLLGEPPHPAAVEKALEQDEVLLEYFPIGERLARWTIGRKKVSAVVLPESWSVIAQWTKKFLASRVASEEIAGKLGAVLFAGLKPLPPKLVIAPTGILHRLPFEALQVGGKTVLETSETRYVPSAGLLLVRGARDVSNGKVIVFADPLTDYNGDGRPDKPPLPFARKEVQAVASVWPGALQSIGAEATEARLRGLSGTGAVLHLACHGFFHPDNPWRSKLFLAPGGGYDGILEAWEVLGLKLDGTRLLTLSGCETGVVSAEKGDDVVGLPRSFLLAGVRTLVASLWPVEDKATSVLMAKFYRELARGRTPAAALRLAKLALKADPELGSPRNWASFVVFGSEERTPVAGGVQPVEKNNMR